MTVTIHKVGTRIHPNIVDNLKFAHKQRTGKDFPLHDLFIYALLEEYWGMGENARDHDEMVLTAMHTLDYQDGYRDKIRPEPK